jgi:hypothetical protein
MCEKNSYRVARFWLTSTEEKVLAQCSDLRFVEASNTEPKKRVSDHFRSLADLLSRSDWYQRVNKVMAVTEGEDVQV